MVPKEKLRLGIVDALRGVAALSVAWFHFTNGGALLADGWLKSSGSYGWLGVEIFFVISGFIIPYALWHADYRASDFGRFLIKRIARLDPPYFAAILLMLGLGFLMPLVPGFRGAPPQYSWGQLAAHLGYINSILNWPWLNPVFWSLGIEFQYYLLIGAIFPILISPRASVRIGLCAVLLLPPFFVRNPALVFEYLPLFVIGILTFQARSGLMSVPTFLAGLSVSTAATWYTHGVPMAAAGAVTALLIQFVNTPRTRLTHLGLISYSLYLLHVPIGGKIVNLGTRFPSTLPIHLLVLAAAVTASVLSAAGFYFLIELPSQRLSSRIRYRRDDSASARAGAVPVLTATPT